MQRTVQCRSKRVAHVRVLQVAAFVADLYSAQQQQPQQVEGQISKEDMERILESLERGEEEVQAKLMKAKSQGKKKKIERIQSIFETSRKPRSYYAN